VTATAIIATIGNGAAFRKGRDFAAWLGVVPEEHSTEASRRYGIDGKPGELSVAWKYSRVAERN
jgi:transposase